MDMVVAFFTQLWELAQAGFSGVNQVLGLLIALVMALVVTPAAAALRVATGPVAVPVLAAVFGISAAVGGILLAIMGTLPVSPYITTISFAIYVVCRIVGARRGRVTRVEAVAAR